MIDISGMALQFRGAPVTLMSEGVEELLHSSGQSVETGLDLILRTATEARMASDVEPTDCILHSAALGAMTVWVERFDCVYEHGRHEGGQWSVFLPSER